jgi:stage II sporulation protein P
MKWHAITVNVNKARKTYNESGVIVRMFFTLMSYSFLTIILLGLAGYAQEKFGAKEPSSSMKGLAASVSSTFFKDMIGMELPLMLLPSLSKM